MSLLTNVLQTTIKPDIYLDISRISELHMVINKHTRDKKQRLMIETYTIAHNALDLKKNARLKKLLTTGTVYGITHPEWITHMIIPQQLTQTYGEKSGAEFLIHQEKITLSSTADCYLTTSFRMDMINQSVEHCRNLGITIDHIISPVQIGKQITDTTNHYSVWIDEKYSWICWHREGEVLYSKGFAIGTDDLVNVIAEKVSVDIDQAKKILHKYGITKHHPEPGMTARLYAVLQPIASMIAVWEGDHTDYAYLKQSYQSPMKLYMYGAGADIVGMDQFFALTSHKSIENNHDSFLNNIINQEATKKSLTDYAALIYTIN